MGPLQITVVPSTLASSYNKSPLITRNDTMQWLWIGLGGFIGSNARYWIIQFTSKLNPNSLIPLGTMTVNILGCFMIGVMYAISLHKNVSHHLHAFFLTGFLGGFTTFSSFGLEAFKLFGNQQHWLALLDVVAQVVVSLLAVAVGYTIAKQAFS